MSHICAPALNDIWNKEIITLKSFPYNLKLRNVAPVFKKEYASLLKNYRPLSVRPVVAKTYERTIQKQILGYIASFYLLTYVNIEKGTVHKQL